MKKYLITLLLALSTFASGSVLTHSLAGVNAQTGTSYTIQATDNTKLVTFNNAAPVAVTLPIGTTPNFGVGSIFELQNLGVGLVTVTCSGCTINGSATLTISTSSGATIFGDGTNYSALLGGGGGTSPASPSGAIQYNNNAALGAIANTAVITPFNWSQTGTAITFPALTGGVSATITLASGITGFDTTGSTVLGGPLGGFPIYILDGGNSETVYVTGGTYTSGAGGTVIFTPFFSHTAGAYTVKSASSGIQEAINATCGTFTTSVYRNGQCKIIIPANGPNNGVVDVWGTIYLHENSTIVSGYGASLNCHTSIRGPCLQLGNLISSNNFGNNTIEGLSFRSQDPTTTAEFAGSAITNTVLTTNVATITTAAAHNFRVGDLVTILFTDNSVYWGDVRVATVPTATTFTFNKTIADIPTQASPGVVALAYSAVFDNSENAKFKDLQYDPVSEVGHFNNFFDFLDDENAVIDHFNNSAISLQNGPNWSGSFVFAGGAIVGAGQSAPVITVQNSNFTANWANCVTSFNSNAIYFNNNVCQATSLWQVQWSNEKGNFQGGSIANMYAEAGLGGNPLSPPHTPYPGTGIGGLIVALRAAAGNDVVTGNGGPQGAIPIYGSGAVFFHYFIVANDVTAGTQTAPLEAMIYQSTGADAPAVIWPRIANNGDTITYDVIRMQMASAGEGVGTVFPSFGNCTGGSVAACGSVATALAQCAGLVCSFTDNAAVATASYTILDGNYAGLLSFWPGSLVTVNRGISIDIPTAPVAGLGLKNSALQVALHCNNAPTSASGFTVCVGSSVSSDVGMLLVDGGQAGNEGPIGLKGRLNISMAPSTTINKTHLITLVDSQPALTRATVGQRPPASANDTWIGLDQANNAATTVAQLAFGSPVAISNYIGNTGDNTSFLERLTATLKSFKLPINTTSYIDVQELAAPGNPSAATCRMYVDNVTHLFTFLNSTGTNCFGGGVTASGASANQVAVFTAGSAITGFTDFVFNSTGTHQLVVPSGAGAVAGLTFSGSSGGGIIGASSGQTFFVGNNITQGISENFSSWNGTSYVTEGQLLGNSTGSAFGILSAQANSSVTVSGKLSTTTSTAAVNLGNNSGAATGTSGRQVNVFSGTFVGPGGTQNYNTFAPTSGTGEYDGWLNIMNINQTGGANGPIMGIGAYAVNTSLGGTEHLFSAGTASTSSVSSTLTEKYFVDQNGSITHVASNGANSFRTDAACETAYAPTTLSLVGATTATGLNCLPTNSIIDAVVYRITTTITGSASFTIGDGTTAARFCGTQSTLTAGTTGTCFVQADQTGAAGPRQTTAAAVVVTGNVTATAGAIRLIVFYHSWTPPTS